MKNCKGINKINIHDITIEARNNNIRNLLDNIENNLYLIQNTCFGSLSILKLIEKKIYIEPANINISNHEANDRTIVIGAAGSGKSLLLCKEFLNHKKNWIKNNQLSIPIVIPCAFLNKSDNDLRAVVKRLYGIDLEYLSYRTAKIYLDGLDELTFTPTAFVKDLINNSTLITCRANEIYKFSALINGFNVVNMPEWTDENTNGLINSYMKIYKISKKKDQIMQAIPSLTKNPFMRNPMMISLYLYAVDSCSEKASDSQLMAHDIFNWVLDKFAAREISRQRWNIENDQIQNIINTSYWIYYSIKQNQCLYNFTLDDLVKKTQEELNNHFGKNIDINITTTMLRQVFAEGRNYAQNYPQPIFHPLMQDFIVARFCFYIIINNLKNIIYINKQHNSSICGFLRDLLRNASIKDGANKWIEDNKPQKPELYFDYIFWIIVTAACNNHNQMLHEIDLVDAELKVEQNAHKKKLLLSKITLLYDQLLQISTEILSVENKIKYEGIYFNKVNSNKEFSSVDLGARLCYVGDLNFHEFIDCNAIIDFKKWDGLLAQYKLHISEKSENSRHYFHRRIELFHLNKLLVNQQVFSNPVFNDAKNFLLGLEEEISENARKNSRVQTYDNEVYNIYKNIKEFFIN